MEVDFSKYQNCSPAGMNQLALTRDESSWELDGAGLKGI